MKTLKLASFKTTQAESKIISQIVDRILPMARKNGVNYDRMDAHMDITACHASGMPLDLQKLLKAPEADFGHDVFGIRRFINRDSGEIEGHFVPRCAARQ